MLRWRNLVGEVHSFENLKEDFGPALTSCAWTQQFRWHSENALELYPGTDTMRLSELLLTSTIMFVSWER